MAQVQSVQSRQLEQSEDLLAKWVSMAESQICALEVLQERVPELNALLTDNVNGVSDHFNRLSERLQVQGELVKVLGTGASADAAANLSENVKSYLTEIRNSR